MMWGLKIIVLLCAVFQVYCLKYNSGNCDGCRNEYTRIKRAKYFSSSPYKLYNRPVYTSPIKFPFSYTPPPGYTASDSGPPNLSYPSNSRPYKVSKKPTNEGLGDEDINNLVKYLSKQDLDKIVKFASEKEKYSDNHSEQADKYKYEYTAKDTRNNDNNMLYKDIQDEDISKYINGPVENVKSYSYDYSFNPNNFITNSHSQGPPTNNQIYSQTPQDTEGLRQKEQFSFLDAYIQKEIAEMTPDKSNVFTDSRTMKEEQLPPPSNLRGNDYDISYTNNIPTVVKPQSSMYRIENFADLPLMNFDNSKLDTTSSYNVPHYTVISANKQAPIHPSQPSSSSSSLSSSPVMSVPEYEPAPPAALAAKEQSDAHLKATKIWTHKSKGTAYTLHDDGTLSLELPTKQKSRFSHS